MRALPSNQIKKWGFISVRIIGQIGHFPSFAMIAVSFPLLCAQPSQLRLKFGHLALSGGFRLPQSNLGGLSGRGLTPAGNLGGLSGGGFTPAGNLSGAMGGLGFLQGVLNLF